MKLKEYTKMKAKSPFKIGERVIIFIIDRSKVSPYELIRRPIQGRIIQDVTKLEHTNIHYKIEYDFPDRQYMVVSQRYIRKIIQEDEKVKDKIQTVTKMELEFDKNKEIESSFIIPLQQILLGMKLVEKDKDRKITTPYVKVELLIPREVGTSIKEVLNSEWKLGLIGIKGKK